MPSPVAIAALFLAMLAPAGLSSVADAATYYVAPYGDDNRNNGQAQNRNTPWRTIQQSVNRAGGGDEVVVLRGTYRENVYIGKSGFDGGEFTLRSEEKEGARVLGWIASNDNSYIRVDGFDVTNESSNGLTKGINFTRCHHVTVRDCRVRNCYGGGISFDQTDWILCEWNIVHENAYFDVNQHSGISVYQPQYRGNDSRKFGVIIRNNTSFANRNFVNNPNFGRPTDGNGIAMDDFKNQQPGGGAPYDRQSLVENNICFDNGGQGIHCYLAQNVRVRNNTCRNNMASFDFGGEVSISESERVYVYNNILVARSGRNAALQFASRDYYFGNNVVQGPTFDLAFDGSTFYGSPQFEGNGFRLSAGSPAVNTGINAGDHFDLDAYGQFRFNGNIDIGAIERY